MAKQTPWTIRLDYTAAERKGLKLIALERGMSITELFARAGRRILQNYKKELSALSVDENDNHENS